MQRCLLCFWLYIVGESGLRFVLLEPYVAHLMDARTIFSAIICVEI